MTATTATPIVSLAKNKTGVFAGDTLHETKSVKTQTIISSRQSHNSNNSNNLLIVASDQTRTKIQQYYRIDQINSMKKEEKDNNYSPKDGIRTGFRPSPIRRQKIHETNSTTHRDLKASSPKQSISTSHNSQKLRSEINQINTKLRVHADINRILRGQQSSDRVGSPRSNLSYTTTYRVPSPCTNQYSDRSHQRFPSSMTNQTVNTLTSFSTALDICSKSSQSLSGISEVAPPIHEDCVNKDDTNPPVTHAYQIPQQSNVGCESIFAVPAQPSPFSIKSTAKKSTNRRSNAPKSVSCPFYVMYFANLALQKPPSSNHTQSEKRLISIPATRIHLPVPESRPTTTYSRYRSGKRRLNTPVTIRGNSNIGDDDNEQNPANTGLFANNKRLSAKIAAYEHENSTLVKDVIRTTSWNHVQI